MNQSNSENTEPKLEVSDPSNPANPYDYIGQLHNEGLRLTLDEWTLMPNSTFQQKMDASLRVSTKVMAANPFTKVLTIDDLDQMTEEQFMKMFADMNNDYQNFINSLDVSYALKTEIRTLFNNVNCLSA